MLEGTGKLLRSGSGMVPFVMLPPIGSSGRDGRASMRGMVGEVREAHTSQSRRRI
jgi:hypothetical protein